MTYYEYGLIRKSDKSTRVECCCKPITIELKEDKEVYHLEVYEYYNGVYTTTHLYLSLRKWSIGYLEIHQQ